MQVINILFIWADYEGIYVKMTSKAVKKDTENLKCYITNLSWFLLKIKKVILGKPEKISKLWLKSISHTN